MTKEPLVVSESDAARMVCLSVYTLRKRRKNNMPPSFVKLGRSVRYRIADLVRFVETEMRVRG
jgi:hypothetical protein